MPEADTTPTEAVRLPQVRAFRQALPWWVQVIVLLVVFAAGGVVGAMISSKVIHSNMEKYRQQAPLFSADIVERLRMRLHLSDEQAVNVQEIVERQHEKLIEHRNNGSEKMHAQFDEMVDEIADELDELQKRQWGFVANYVRRTYLPASIPTSPRD
jgi:E3 ubiquitin-protein ligase DOA10